MSNVELLIVLNALTKLYQSLFILMMELLTHIILKMNMLVYHLIVFLMYFIKSYANRKGCCNYSCVNYLLK